MTTTADSNWYGSPFDRGGADAYYGRQPNPHKFVTIDGFGFRLGKECLTADEIKSYLYGYYLQEDRKDYGI